jgi:hypothetical protein
MKSKVYHFLFGVSIVIFVQIICASLYFYNIPGWKKAWLLNRVRLIYYVDNTQLDSLLFSVPDSWLNKKYLSISPSEYVKSRNINYLSKNELGEDENLKYLNSLACINDLTSTLKEVKSYQKYKSSGIYTDKDYGNIIRGTIGFSPIRASNFKLSGERIYDRNGLIIPMKILKGNESKIVIAVHGSGSNADAVIGLKSDYVNSFGKYWNSKGYTVYSLSVGNREPLNISFPRLGLSLMGADLAKIEDLSLYIRNKYKSKAHIVIVGISYGAILAELSGFLFENIDGVVSVGGSIRYDFMLSEFSHSVKHNNSDIHIWLKQNFFGEVNYKKIIDLGKYLLVSVGTGDAGSWGESGQSKFILFNSLKSYKNSGRFDFLFFHGGHESNPALEVERYSVLLNKLINKKIAK